MKLALAIFVGFLSAAPVAIIGASAGGSLAHAIAEGIYGQREPMIAMIFGGVLGLLLGTGGGVVLGVYLGARTYGILNRKSAPETESAIHDA